MNKIKYFSFLILIVFFSGCQTQEKTAQTVSSVDKGMDLPSDAIIYTLPRTIIKVEVVAEKVTMKKGPLSAYSKKYLGLERGIKEDRTEWILKIENVTSSEEVDPDQYYMVRSNGLVSSNFLQLSKNGLVLMPVSQESSFIRTGQPGIEEEEIEYFKDRSVKPNLIEKSDTVYSLLETDTGFVKVPHVQLKNRYKTLDEKAAEAAAFIIKIRKRRFKLLSGQYDVFPEGIALEYAVNELTRLENEYLSLFIGKTVTQQVYRTFTYLPKNEDNEDLSEVLFRFSSTKGILPEKDLTGSPVTIKVNKLNPEDPFKSLAVNNASEDVSDLIYRIPVPCRVELSDEMRSLGTTDLLIYQMGPLVRLPDNVDLSPEK